ncbi:MAG: EAL domain-containing protein [Gammaproteobacteria bacterium]
MHLSNMIQIYRGFLKLFGTVAINAMFFYIFIYIGRLIQTPNLINYSFSLFLIIASNVILWRIGVFNKSDSNINERLFREFTENITEVFWRSTPDLSKTIYVSAAYDEIWGRSRLNLLNNPQEWFESIIPEDQNRVKNTLLQLTDENTPNVTFEYTIQRPDGDLRQIYTRGFKFKNRNGELVNILGISTDITGYKREQKTKIILKEIKNILDNKKDLAIIVPNLLRTICVAFKWDYGEMWLIDKEENVLRSVNIWDNTERDFTSEFDKKSQLIIFKPGDILPGEIWNQKKLIWVENIESVELLRTIEAAQAGFNSAVGIPLFMNNDIIGVLDFFSHEIKKPDEITINILEKINEEINLFIGKKHTQDQIIYVSRHDAQTFLLNQSALKDKIKKILLKSADTISILLLEINNFNIINSTMGFESSNFLLERIVERLRKVTPQPDDQLGRYETNIFAFCLTYRKVEEIIDFSHVILDLFDEPFFINHEDIFLSVNIGITINALSENDINTLFKQANLALNQSIQTGKNNFTFFSSEISNITHDKLLLETSLRHALINNEFILYYQPKVNLITGEIAGVEALIRWQHPLKGLLSPADFIHLAEETGLILQLDEWVLREVFALIKNDWPMNPNGKGLIAINISPQHFKPKNDIISYIKNLMQEFNINPKLIEIEITENVALNKSKYDLNLLNKLIKMGFYISLDDFGTGFNSLNYLLHIPAHTVKIDKSFIDGLPNNKNSIAIVRAVITLCHSLDKKVIAEGVETLEQLQFLKQEDCDEIQGYYFSRPVPINELKNLISEHKKLAL